MADPELPSSEAAGLTEYEAQRLQLIARNRARLMALGIPSAVEGLSILAPPPKKQHARWVPLLFLACPRGQRGFLSAVRMGAAHSDSAMEDQPVAQPSWPSASLLILLMS